MSRYTYRCNACRARNTFNKRLAEYVRDKKCKACGHTRFYVDRERMSRIACTCSGYHFPHRPDSRCCERNVLHGYHRARRSGITGNELLDIFAEEAWDNPPTKPWKGRDTPI